jgi:hypothetical protein
MPPSLPPVPPPVPIRSTQDCGSYLDEIGCEFAEYDDSTRSIKYSHPDSQPDDTLHALNYALLIGTRMYNSTRGD